MSDNHTFTTGQQIRIIMAARGFTQTALAKAIEVDSSIVSLICNDKVSPTPAQIQAIKMVLAWPPNADEAFAILAATNGDEPHDQ